MTPIDLLRLGWDAAFARDFEMMPARGLIPGRVALEHNHIYRVLTEDGERLAEASGRIKYQATGRSELPAVGDWVAMRPDARGSRSLIRFILPRRSVFSRKTAGRETQEQVVAANIDTVFLVFGLDKPVNPRAIERYLVVARHSGARPVVVLNKADLLSGVARSVAEASAVAGDVDVVGVSARDDSNIESLVRYFEPGQTVALLGPSGAGKSSIVNRLVGREILPTGEVREWDARGRHTTIHRQLVVREEGGLVIDTPGLRELQLWDSGDAFDETFGEIAALAEGCRFRDCRHDREPGCAVKAAVEAGTLETGRYESYLKLQREREALDVMREERAQLDAKRQGRIGQKAMRSFQKQRDRK